MNNKLNHLSAIRFLFPYMKGHLSIFVRFYLGWLFDTILSIVMPILFGIMIDQIVYQNNLPLFFKLSGMYVVLAVFLCILYLFIYAQHHYLINMFTLNIRMDVFRHLHNCNAEYLSNMSSGDINTLLEQDCSECMHFLIRNVIHPANRFLSLAITLIYLYMIDFRIGIFATLTAPLSVCINTRLGKLIRARSDRQRETYGNYAGWLFEILGAIKDIKVLGAEKHTEHTFQGFHRDICKEEKKVALTSYTAGKLTELVSLLIRLCIYGFAGYLAFNGSLTIGVLTIVLSFYSSLTNKISILSSSYLDGLQRLARIQRIHDFLRTPAEKNMTKPRSLNIRSGNIELRHLHFSYKDSSPLLSEVNLTIHSGQRIAIIGESGIGKSTLAYLLLGFYQPTEGEIYVDGQKLSDCSLPSIRSQIGLVAQDVLIFPGTIRENLMLNLRNLTDEELLTACKHAGLHEFISRLPDGLDTLIGTDGKDLSGGQKQRISIARIYLRNPKIIIFDEATSALDTETEKEIHLAWNKALLGRTSIIITHRCSTLLHCDRIAVLEKGKLCYQK